LDRTYLSGIERGVRNPGIKVVIRRARGLRVSIDRQCGDLDGSTRVKHDILGVGFSLANYEARLLLRLDC
jgi:hypothetical protein